MHAIKASPKLTELRKKCSEAFNTELKTGSWQKFDKFNEEVFFECMSQIRTDFSITLPSLRLRRCNNKGFDELRRRHGIGKSTTAVYIPAESLIAVNLEAIMTERSEGFMESFIGNLVLNMTEELIHAAFPRDAKESKQTYEQRIKNLTHTTVERYLGTQLPEEYKKGSIERAGQLTYGRD